MKVFHHVYNLYLYSGATNQALKLSKELIDNRSCEVVFVNTEKKPTIRYLPYPVYNLGGSVMTKLFRILLIIANSNKNETIHHVHGYHLLELMVLCFFRRNVLFKCTLEGHDDLETLSKSRLKRPFLKYILRNVNFVNSLNPKIKAINERYVQSNKNIVIPNGVHTERRCFDINRDCEGYFLFVGAIVERKGVLGCIKWFLENVKDDSVKLKLVGPFNSGLSEETNDYLNKVRSQIGDRVSLEGKLEESELSREFQGALGILFNSSFEGTPNVILEAMSFNCPVINIPDDVVVDWLLGDDLAKKLDVILRKPTSASLVALRKSKLLERRVEHFSIKSIAESTYTIYEEMIRA
ncbi:glycosyltransferase family 4 protein [Vibrio sp. 10N.286.51.E5]|uniref:glycosyltransferase family 4 protein n=1 Tax=Vibrio sp. 10N.286.51.E5 TaxID=3229709 RepID=UPI00354C6692